MITILVLSGSSLQVVIVYQVENQYAKACMNYGLKCVLSENNKKSDKIVNIQTMFMVPQGKIFRAPNNNHTSSNPFFY